MSTIFLEEQFPVRISNHATGGPAYRTTVVIMDSGDEDRNAEWSQGRARYEVSFDAKRPYEFDVLLKFFRSMQGRFYGFRFKDWADFIVSVDDGVLGTGVGTGYPTLQMGKRYDYGTRFEIRRITKPIVTVAPSIYKNGVLLLEGTAPGQETPDLSSGIVTFYPTSSANIIGITNANPAVVTTSGVHGFANGKIIHLSGIGSMNALNGVAFPISAASGSSFALTGIDTTDYPAYGGSGEAKLYPQPTDVMTWAGQFDVPCRLDTDEFKGEIIERGPNGELIQAWTSIPILEIREP